MVAHGEAQSGERQAAGLVSVTPTAAEQVRQVLAKRQQPEAVVRLFIAGRTCSGFQFGMSLADGPDADDILIEDNGVRVVVDQVSAPLLQGAEIDFVDTVMQRGFTIISATETGGGCGGGCSCGRGGGGCGGH